MGMSYPTGSFWVKLIRPQARSPSPLFLESSMDMPPDWDGLPSRGIFWDKLLHPQDTPLVVDCSWACMYPTTDRKRLRDSHIWNWAFVQPCTIQSLASIEENRLEPRLIFLRVSSADLRCFVARACIPLLSSALLASVHHPSHMAHATIAVSNLVPERQSWNDFCWLFPLAFHESMPNCLKLQYVHRLIYSHVETYITIPIPTLCNSICDCGSGWFDLFWFEKSAGAIGLGKNYSRSGSATILGNV